MPFATNLQVQVLSCSGEKKLRLILNDAPIPLTGINGCPEDDDGLCPVDTFVAAMKTLIGEIDFAKECALDKETLEEEQEVGEEEMAEVKVDGLQKVEDEEEDNKKGDDDDGDSDSDSDSGSDSDDDDN